MSRRLTDALGSLLAVLSGAGYVLFTFTRAWENDDSAGFEMTWVVESVTVIALVMTLLMMFLRPRRPWMYPLMFSLPGIAAALVGLRDPAGPSYLWLSFSAFTILVSFTVAYLSRYSLSRVARSHQKR